MDTWKPSQAIPRMKIETVTADRWMRGSRMLGGTRLYERAADAKLTVRRHLDLRPGRRAGALTVTKQLESRSKNDDRRMRPPCGSRGHRI